MDATAALKGVICHFFNMVVPKYKKQRFIEVGNNKIKVIEGKITRAKDKIHIGITVFYGTGIHQGVYLIGNT
jgi:hypothetical protein